MTGKLYRFDTVPLEQVATLNGTRCMTQNECDLIRDHATECAVVSTNGLVHKIIPEEPPLTKEETAAMIRLMSACEDLDNAIENLEDTERILRATGPERVKRLLRNYYSTVMFDWPIPSDELDWEAALEGRY